MSQYPKVFDERFALWTRNVIDKYKSLSNEEIKRELQKTALPMAVLMSQIEGDFNFSNVVRTANAFNLREVFYHGRKHYDRRGTTGTHTYTPVRFLAHPDELRALKQQYFFVGLENNLSKSTYNLTTYRWQPNTLLLLGEEGCGLQPEVLEMCNELVEIKMWGSVRSLNVATAAGIAMHHASTQLRATIS